ncbi:MAG: nitrogenase component 1 [Ignavibacteria bacterium]
MNYLDRNSPPTREERHNSCTAFGGSVCQLLQGSKQGCLGSGGRGFSQSSACQMMLTLAMTGTIPESVIIFHGPVGCGSCMLSTPGISKQNQLARGNKDSIGQVWFSTNLSEQEVVGGGEEKLSRTILEADRRFSPQVIFIAETCVPAIIGDDIDAVTKNVQGQISAKILPLHCAGFKTKVVATAYDVVYHSILRYIITDEAQKTPEFKTSIEQLEYEEKKKRTINLLNVASMSRVDEVELVRLLTALDLEVNILPCFAPPDRFVRAKDAALSVSICATHDDYFVEHLKELYGIPYILNTIPIGTDNVKKWLLEIAEFFNITEKAEKLIATEEAEVREALEPVLESLKGKSAFVSAGEIRAGATAILLENDLNMRVLGVRAHHYDHFGDVLFETIPRKETMQTNVGSQQPFEQVNMLLKTNPDIYLGHTGGNVWAAKLGIPVIPIFGPVNSYMGYKGIYELAIRMERILSNPSYYKTLGSTAKQPYKESWYAEDPFKYINQTQIMEAIAP